MDKDIEYIKDKLLSLKPRSTVFIAVDGRSGSGKTTFSNNLKKQLKNSEVIHIDKFNLYEPEMSYKKLIAEVFNVNKNKKYVIVEGVFSLLKEFRSYYSYKIWIDLPEEIGFERGLKRDIRLNGIDNSDKWKKYWLPKEREYIIKDRPNECADYVVSLK